MGVSENVVYPIVPNGFADHYPYEKWLFHWEYTQRFQTNPYFNHFPNVEKPGCLKPKWINGQTSNTPGRESHPGSRSLRRIVAMGLAIWRAQKKNQKKGERSIFPMIFWRISILTSFPIC